ncbi:succinate--CoA ligase subunit alpha [soil metagenome]
MAILLDEKSRVLVVGGTGGYGAAQLEWMRKAGTNVVGLISPGRGGEPVGDLPSFDLIAQAVEATGANAAMFYVPAPGVHDALIEAADAGLKLVVAAAELVPIHDTIKATAYARERGTWVVGPNTAGLASPGKALLGSIPEDFTTPGPVGVMSRSGTLSIISSRILTRGGFGQTTVVAMGGDPVIGQPPVAYFRQFDADPETRAIVYLGEVGGASEYDLLPLIEATKKPVVTAIVGRSAPPGKAMGHAGALIRSDRETADAKRGALREAGAIVVDSVDDLPHALRELAVTA